MSFCYSAVELLLGTWPSACYQRVDVLSQLFVIYSAFELLLGTWPSACYQRLDVLSQLLDSPSLGSGIINHPLRDKPGLKTKNAQQVENDQFVSTQNSTSRSTRERNG